ncbi:MAG: toxin-antitoxin system YwqK family antitoxin [Bacteroidales bacterium]|jgi:antitoxin component YwqK of YwqJK toxin-antitoxin module
MRIFRFFVFPIILLSLIACKNSNKEVVIGETWSNGKPKKTTEYITDKDGQKRIFKQTMFHENENKFMEGTFSEQQERDGKWTAWFENGKKNSEGTYVNGKEEGKYTVWYPNGKIRYTGYYKNGERNGKWKFYNEEGKLINEIDY